MRPMAARSASQVAHLNAREAATGRWLVGFVAILAAVLRRAVRRVGHAQTMAVA